MNYIKIILFYLITLVTCSCSEKDATTEPQTQTCDFSSFVVSATEDYSFDANLPDFFSQSPRWESSDADITLVNQKGQLTASSDNNAQVLEAWKLYKTQMPYNKSWEISIDINIPLYWNTNGGNQAQVGAGIYAGKPVNSGQSSKVYECNFAAINNGERFVQAQLVANRLGDDPIDVQFTIVNQLKEFGTLKIKFCAINKELSLFLDNTIVGNAQAINSTGLDNWELTDQDVIDIGIMGFAENTTIKNNQPTLDNFSYKIY